MDANEEFNDFLTWAKELVSSEVRVSREPHGDEGVVYRLESDTQKYFLKIKSDSNFQSEREHLIWLKDKLPVPDLLGFTTKDGVGAILLTAVEGKNLKVLSEGWTPEKVIEVLVSALHTFHSVNTQEWPFERMEGGTVLVHGDACLPNFIFHNGKFSGYIDLGEVKVGNVELDLAAAIWSLQYNLGKGYGSAFLKRYGYQDTSEETVERLRFQYEDFQKAHGFLL